MFPTVSVYKIVTYIGRKKIDKWEFLYFQEKPTKSEWSTLPMYTHVKQWKCPRQRVQIKNDIPYNKLKCWGEVTALMMEAVMNLLIFTMAKEYKT